jgi:hypothetical protein
VDNEVSWGPVIADGVAVIADAEAAVPCWTWVPRGYERVVVEDGTLGEIGWVA